MIDKDFETAGNDHDNQFYKKPEAEGFRTETAILKSDDGKIAVAFDRQITRIEFSTEDAIKFARMLLVVAMEGQQVPQAVGDFLMN